MRILHAVTRFLAAGSERNIVNWMRWEQGTGHEVHLAFGRDSDRPAVPEDVLVHELPTLVRSVRPLRDLRARRQIQQLLDRGHFDVLHTHQSKAGVVGREAARKRVPILVHTVHMSSFGPGYSPIASAAFVAAERYCARFTDVIVCVGEELKQDYVRAEIGRPEQYRVIRSPIDIDRFASAREVPDGERATLREAFGVRPGTQVAVAIGALERRKRHELLISELAPLMAAGRLDLLIAGAGPRRADLLSLAHRLGCASGLHLLGHVQDTPRLLAAADVLVHASASEGVPQVVIQALAAGRPVVATEVTGLREVPDAPVTLVEADGAALASTVRSTLDNPASAVPVAALDDWRPEHVHAEIERMHEDLAAYRPAARARSGTR